MCDGCQHCQDVDYLSEDSDDSYFLHEPYYWMNHTLDEPYESERSIDEFDNTYNISFLFEPDIYRDDNLSDRISVADDWWKFHRETSDDWISK